jgi:hypothetical protein
MACEIVRKDMGTGMAIRMTQGVGTLTMAYSQGRNHGRDLI